MRAITCLLVALCAGCLDLSPAGRTFREEPEADTGHCACTAPEATCVDGGREAVIAQRCLNDGGCARETERTECPQGCTADGRCLGQPCLGVRCETPPEPRCVDPRTLRVASLGGQCVDGDCRYASVDVSCACADGRCASEPCLGVQCTTAPAARCLDASTLRTFASIGVCHDGGCEHAPTDVPCGAGGCVDGRCAMDACLGVTCPPPPGSTCVDSSTVREAVDAGSCVLGTCRYPMVERACPDGCDGGRCLSAACATVSCAVAPAATCTSATTLRQYAAPGTCAEGVCSFGTVDSSCAHGCSNGACASDPCTGVTCQRAQPAPTCVSPSTLRTEAATGTCSQGACRYPSNDVSCQYGCVNGACAPPPCIGGAFTCSTGCCSAKALTVGGRHGCVVLDTGEVACWGANASGQLGDGTTVARATPRRVLGLPGPAQSLAAGLDFSCALLSTGAVWCWGGNGSGQLGDGSTTSRGTPRVVGGLAPAKALVANTEQRAMCALLVSGGVSCWGSNLFPDFVGLTHTPRLQGSLGTSVASMVVDFTGCAVKGTSSVCWGGNGFGQRATGDRNEAAGATSTVLPTDVVEIVIGSTTGCARHSGGKVSCWGNADYGQIGDGSYGQNLVKLTPQVALASGAARLRAGARLMCALGGGAISCWGTDSGTRMGLPGTRWTTPKASAFGGGLVDFAMSDGHLCALASNGTIRCAGENGSGQSGPAPFTRKDTPTLITE